MAVKPCQAPECKNVGTIRFRFLYVPTNQGPEVEKRIRKARVYWCIDCFPSQMEAMFGIIYKPKEEPDPKLGSFSTDLCSSGACLRAGFIEIVLYLDCERQNIYLIETPCYGHLPGYMRHLEEQLSEAKKNFRSN